MSGRPDHAGCALILATLAALSFGTLVHVPLGVMAILGVIGLARDPGQLRRDAGIRVLVLAFLCLWLPMLLALPDAVEPGRAVKTTAAYLHVLPAALYVARVVARPCAFTLVFRGTLVILAFWCADAALQAAVGRDLLGHPYDGTILKGAFYPNQRLGLVLATLAPLGCEGLRRATGPWRWAWLAVPPYALVLALSLKRSAWVMLGLALGGYAVLLWLRGVRPRAGAALAAVLAAVLVVGGAAWHSPALRERVASAGALASGDYATLDRASSWRLSLWHTGLRMTAAHPLNGIGPRGFRYVYPQYAPADDFWMRSYGRGQTHPHLMLLEVAIETGVPGLLGLLVFWALWLRTFVACARDAPGAAAFLLALGVAWFPLNAHLAFYGSWWSALAWWLLAIGVGARAAERAQAD